MGFRRILMGFVFGLALATTAPAFPDATTFDPAPWIDDLHEIRAAMTEKYANFDSAVFEREVNLTELFANAEKRLSSATSDADARAIIDRALRSIGDGHLRMRWPANEPTPPATDSTHLEVCKDLGYDSSMSGRPVGPGIPGYHSLPDATAAEFPAGWIELPTAKVGIIRIGLFAAQGYPALCASAVEQLAIQQHAPCDAPCRDRLETAEYAALSQKLAVRIRQFQQLGVTVLLIDVTENGGGSEWAEAAARIVSPLRLHSEVREGVRGRHWAQHWASVIHALRAAAGSASPGEGQQLESLVAKAENAEAEANTPCSSDPYWSGKRPACSWLSHAFYATGLLGDGDVASLRGKPWGSLVFSPAQYDFRESAWRGPLIVLVDGGTGSASEEFAAVLQDNKAAIIMGSPTVGAGCGHTDGGTPTPLSHSGGILELPDCARIRKDGSNEVNGIEPDILIGFRAFDGIHRRASRTAAALPGAVAAAVRLCEKTSCRAPPLTDSSRGGR